MSITDPKELEGMRAAGTIVRKMIEAMKQAVRAGRDYGTAGRSWGRGHAAAWGEVSTA